MKASQILIKDGEFGKTEGDIIPSNAQALILGFGAKGVLVDGSIYHKLAVKYPAADIVLCSTAGEIYDAEVYDNTVSIIIMEFENTGIRTKSINIDEQPDSFEAGKRLFRSLHSDELSHIMILSDGGLVNGSELVLGLEYYNLAGIPITGGMAGDGDHFDYTIVGCNCVPSKGNIVAIGFYGKNLKVNYGSLGGWDIFGIEKKVTRSVSNRLFEIDNKNALEIYKKYLGKYAAELPRSALFFPLYVRPSDAESAVVRTILYIDNNTQSMVFAGDIPEGSYIRFMRADFNKLVNAASSAANFTLAEQQGNSFQMPKIALLISCVGRKLVLNNRVDEEIEAIKDVYGKNTLLTGFYSYGEISPHGINKKCRLHNQTMTITTFDEE